MGHGPWVMVAALWLSAGLAAAGEPAKTEPFTEPLKLTLLQEEFESVYAPPAPPRDDEGINEGGVNIDLTVRYLTDHVFRGIDRSEVGGHEDAPNLQFDGRLIFNFGKIPHPYVGVFVNVFDPDPESSFQEIRPFVGFEWTIRPLIVDVGHQTFMFPEREPLNTSEVYAKLTFDDSWLFGTERPILSPYIMGAYDYDLYNGLYLEAGVQHDFVFDDWGAVLSAVGRVSYVRRFELFSLDPGVEVGTGFQRYELGLIGTYSLNRAFNFSPRYGQWSLKGYLFYTDNIDNDLRADTQLWGGVGIGFWY
jgi:hypothetical protein